MEWEITDSPNEEMGQFFWMCLKWGLKSALKGKKKRQG
jgi:hypothetical protein